MTVPSSPNTDMVFVAAGGNHLHGEPPSGHTLAVKSVPPEARY